MSWKSTAKNVPEGDGGAWGPERRMWRQRDAPKGSASFSEQHPIAGGPREGQQPGYLQLPHRQGVPNLPADKPLSMGRRTGSGGVWSPPEPWLLRSPASRRGTRLGRGHVLKPNEGAAGSPAHLSRLTQAHGWRQLSPKGKNRNHSLGGSGKPEEEATARGSAIAAEQGLSASPCLSRGSPAPSNV